MTHDLIPLAELSDWKLEHERQDIRGWPVRDGHDRAIGTVREMLVNREHERVAAVTLSDGSTLPVERISIRDDHISLEPDGVEGGRARAGEPNQEERIQIVEERLKIGKREVETGGVRVHSYIVEQPAREEVRLRTEHVEVERRPVEEGRFKPEQAQDLLRDREVEFRETAEEAVVEKRAVVKDELVIQKEAVERVEDINAKVRRTEVDIEPLQGGR